MVDKKKLEIKKEMKKKKPSFKRHEESKHAKLKKTWRKPKGKHSKQRMHEKSKGALPKPGYMTPANLRGMNKNGFFEILVNNVSDIEKLDPKTQVALIASGVGSKKKLEISAKAAELKVKLINYRSATDDAK